MKSVPNIYRKLAFILLLAKATNLFAQCPNNGQTKVFNSAHGEGFYFYKFVGDSSFRFFLSGKSFSFNDKGDPGKTFIFIDDLAYEPISFNKEELKKYSDSSKPADVLRAQAKHAQDYFKSVVSSMVITDYGPSVQKNLDGSDGRLFYLWKKENAPGDKSTAQYLVSTMVGEQVAVLSFMAVKAPISEDDMLLRIQTYTSHFALLSGDQCSKALATTP